MVVVATSSYSIVVVAALAGEYTKEPNRNDIVSSRYLLVGEIHCTDVLWRLCGFQRSADLRPSGGSKERSIDVL